MLYYQIKNYEDFKKRFGLTTRENGVISRKNKILLGHLKNPLLLRYCLRLAEKSYRGCQRVWKERREAYKQGGTDRGNLSLRIVQDK